MKPRLPLTALPLLLSLTSCGAAYHDQLSCRAKDPQPGKDSVVTEFGPIPAAITAAAMVSTPEWQEWKHNVAACVEARRFARSVP